MPKSVADNQQSKKCCKWDYNNDGNCHIHYSPGLFRRRYDEFNENPTRDEQTEELVDRADWLLDKEKEENDHR